IPINNTIRGPAIAIFNKCYAEFDIEPYLLAYFLHLGYRGLGLYKGTFRQICEIAVKYYKSIYSDEAACRQMTTQLIYYNNKEFLYDFDYDFSKPPSLWWGVIEDKYSNLQKFAQIVFAIMPSQAKSMAQIHSFYISNLKNELKFYGKELSESELHDSALTQTTYTTTNNNDIICELNDISESFQFSNHKNLEIESIVNLSSTNFGGQDNDKEIPHTTITQGSGNMDFDPSTIVESEL
ncbi:10580_t:CDS:2, partial [Racocetra fulgida]